jgi:hypothetical protein
MDTITKLGGSFQVSDTGGDKPKTVIIKSSTLKQWGWPVDLMFFFRSKDDCEAMRDFARGYDAMQKRKYE